MKKLVAILFAVASLTSFGQSTKPQLFSKIDQMSTYKSDYMKSLCDSIVKSMQLQLVSGTNIKTVNGNSLLGSGDLTVGGGGGISGLTANFLPYATGATTIANSALKYVSDAQGLRVGTNLFTVPGINSGSAPFQIYNHGFLSSDGNRNSLPKGIVVVNWSLNLANNWQWDNVDQRAEPYDVTYPMIDLELGGEGVISHYTAPGSIPATAFHEINRFGGSVEGLSGIDPYTVHVPFNQFKATIFASYSNNTTPPAGTNEAWWGGSNNILDGRLNPLIWLHSDEQKGTLGTFNDNEYFRLENNGIASAYPAMYFYKSTGGFGAKTAALTNQIVGKIGGNAYDGTTWQNTAAIDFTTRGTISSGNAAQSIRFRLSATNTAGLTPSQEWFPDVITWNQTPYRFNHSSISTVPSYSSVFTPTNATSTIGQWQALSTSTGGSSIFGLSTTSSASSAVALSLSGVLGATSPTAPSFVISGRKHNGTTGFADLAATEIVGQIRNNGTAVIEILGNGKTGFGATTPHSRVQTTSFATAYVAKTALYTLTDADHTVEVTSGTHTQTLPTAVGIAGRIYAITNSGSGTVTVGTTSSQTFVNVTATPTTLSLTQFKFVQVQSNGTNWLVISQN